MRGSYLDVTECISATPSHHIATCGVFIHSTNRGKSCRFNGRSETSLCSLDCRMVAEYIHRLHNQPIASSTGSQVASIVCRADQTKVPRHLGRGTSKDRP